MQREHPCGRTRAQWVQLAAVASPRYRLVLFPHAGGGPSALLDVVRLCPDETEVWALTMTGRDARARDEEDDAVDDIVESVRWALAERSPVATVFFGCSLGALLAIRAAQCHPELCDGVVVASQTPGERDRLAEAAVDSTDLSAFLVAAGMTAPEVLEVEAIRNELHARLHHDLALVDQCSTGFGLIRVVQDLYVLAGINDDIAPAAAMGEWQQHSCGTSTVVAVPGGHFAFLEARNREPVTMVLGAAFRAAERRRAAGSALERKVG
ncbi:alpha/beta fold hydrolase [Nocardiopsis tropica]